MDNQPEVIPESPTVVQGGPLDPSSPEGQAPEGNEVGAPVTPTPEAPFYSGLTGDIKSVDELKTYTKTLENLFAQAKATQTLQPAPVLNAPIVPQTVLPTGPTAKDRFSELIFSKPEEAYEIAVSESKRQMRAEMEAERNQEKTLKNFWNNFYEKNQDLKNFQDVVQSMVKAKSAEIANIRTESECADFISKESRKLVDTVKKQLGVTEVHVPSQPAVAFGANREVPQRAPAAPQAPLNFAQQIRQIRPKALGKK